MMDGVDPARMRDGVEPAGAMGGVACRAIRRFAITPAAAA
jgi:hypothetical protein